VLVVSDGIALCGDIVACTEPFVIRVMGTMSVEHFERDLMSEAAQECENHSSRRRVGPFHGTVERCRTGPNEKSSVCDKPGASVRSAIVRMPHRKVSINMPERAYLQSAARCAR
jgi:hypothetical protein